MRWIGDLCLGGVVGAVLIVFVRGSIGGGMLAMELIGSGGALAGSALGHLMERGRKLAGLRPALSMAGALLLAGAYASLF